MDFLSSDVIRTHHLCIAAGSNRSGSRFQIKKLQSKDAAIQKIE